MELTSYDKIDMSLDEIIQLEKNKKKWQQTKQPRQYYKYRTSGGQRLRPFYWQRNNGRRNYSFQNRQYPLMLFTRKWRRLHALKSIKRAKHILQQQRRRWSLAYKKWEASSRLADDQELYPDTNWDENVAPWQTPSRTNRSQLLVKRQRNWTPKEDVDNLTVKLQNDLAQRSRLYRKYNPQRSKALKGPLLLGRQSPLNCCGVNTMTTKSKGIDDLYPVVFHTAKSMHERFSLRRPHPL